jgi:hypothetical protein
MLLVIFSDSSGELKPNWTVVKQEQMVCYNSLNINRAKSDAMADIVNQKLKLFFRVNKRKTLITNDGRQYPLDTLPKFSEKLLGDNDIYPQFLTTKVREEYDKALQRAMAYAAKYNQTVVDHFRLESNAKIVNINGIELLLPEEITVIVHTPVDFSLASFYLNKYLFLRAYIGFNPENIYSHDSRYKFTKQNLGKEYVVLRWEYTEPNQNLHSAEVIIGKKDKRGILTLVQFWYDEVDTKTLVKTNDIINDVINGWFISERKLKEIQQEFLKRRIKIDDAG